MRYAVIGGDMRLVHLVGMLKESGREAAGFLQEKANAGSKPLEDLKNYEGIIANWPVRHPLAGREPTADEIMDQIAPGSTLMLCGPKFPEEKKKELKYANLWEDERLLRENAWLTAEAAVQSALRRSGKTALHAKCAVIGYGRIGRALTEILINLGARVTVISRSEEKCRQARSCGARTADMSDMESALRGKQMIFSTPPAQVIDNSILKRLDSSALLMDLASPPYGFDLDSALEFGLNACREPGLPGRYCPLSAARAIYHAVLRWEEEENG